MLQESGNYLIIEIIDNGCGFNIENEVVTSGNKYGLLFMKERAAEIGGSLSIYSEVGSGTTVKFQVPIQTSRNNPMMNTPII